MEISLSDKTEYDYRLFFILNFPRAAILDLDVIWLLYCFTQNIFCLLTIAATI